MKITLASDRTTSQTGRFTSLAARWQQWTTPLATERDAAFRERTIRAITPFVAGLLVIVVILILLLPSSPNERAIVWAALLGVVLLAGFAVSQGRSLPAGLLLISIFELAIVIVIRRQGFWSVTSMYVIFLAVPMAVILLPRKVAVIAIAAMNLLYVIMTIWQGANGINQDVLKTTWDEAIPTSILVTAGFGLVIAMFTYLFNELDARLQNVNQLVDTLEQRVAERTRDLRIASEVARQITTVLTLDSLLPQLVEHTRTGFDLYFVSVYLFRSDSQELVLETGTGEAGQRIKAEGRAFHLSTMPSLVAKAARERRPVVVNDVTQTEAFAPNPYLPATRSEAELPMIVGDELIGILSLQSDKQDHFGENIEILLTLAEQIAIAIRNAQSYAVQVQAVEQLRQADQMKNQFLSSMSHELRTPLNAILNFTEIVSLGLVGPVNKEQVELLNRALNSSKHLLGLINDILDLNKIQAGKLALFMEDNVSLYLEMKVVAEMAESLIQGKPVKLMQDIDANMPLVFGDKQRIRQVLINLISNATKFTQTGTITLAARQQGNHILFTVSDTGPGIPEEMKEAIFEPFVQTETGLRHVQGTGLGLSISKNLMEAHGGRLWVESVLGEGATFYATLPLQPATG